jgi:dTDP-glucose 4,6-dehydratase
VKALVTGGAGFIGSGLVQTLMHNPAARVTVIDKLTYAANPASLAPFAADARFKLITADICNAPLMTQIVCAEAPDVIFHLAAETHVDRSIDGAGVFVETNLIGTYAMLQAARGQFEKLTGEAAARFRFLHISTDEVFGSLGDTGQFSETTPYDPSSPYSATKAGSDHLVRAWHRTYGLPVLISNCSNNYGPRQFPEKLIPLMILNALEGRPLPVYGTGGNVRDWLHVLDHARALVCMAETGQAGATYAIGGDCERTNLQVVMAICTRMDELFPQRAPHAKLVSYVTDRPGHDHRYSVNAAKIARDLGWRPKADFEAGLADTVDWYLAHSAWWKPLRAGVYAGERLGQTGNRAP